MILAEQKPSMLVIDDDVAILRMFKRIFEKNGYEVVTAETGKEGQEKLQQHCYVATLVDLRLPDMNGIDLLPRLEEVDPAMVKVVITGMPTSDNACKAAQKGADIFLAKPVQPEVLLNVLEIKLKEKKGHAATPIIIHIQ
jgi:two-component system response regulator HydG